MKIISTAKGFILHFSSIKDLDGVVQHLQGILEWVSKERVEPPYLYSMYDERIDSAEMQELLDSIKEKD